MGSSGPSPSNQHGMGLNKLKNYEHYVPWNIKDEQEQEAEDEQEHEADDGQEQESVDEHEHETVDELENEAGNPRLQCT